MIRLPPGWRSMLIVSNSLRTFRRLPPLPYVTLRYQAVANGFVAHAMTQPHEGLGNSREAHVLKRARSVSTFPTRFRWSAFHRMGELLSGARALRCPGGTTDGHRRPCPSFLVP